jgi:hypothetical protein
VEAGSATARARTVLTIVKSHRLVHWKTVPDNRGTGYPIIKHPDLLKSFMCYVANCPICGEQDGKETITVQSGRLEFWGRLVG